MKGLGLGAHKFLVSAARWLRENSTRIGRRTSRRSLRLVDSVMLAERRQLAVVEFGGELLLLGASTGDMRLLARTKASGAEFPASVRRFRAATGKQGWVQ